MKIGKDIHGKFADELFIRVYEKNATANRQTHACRFGVVCRYRGMMWACAGLRLMGGSRKSCQRAGVSSISTRVQISIYISYFRIIEF